MSGLLIAFALWTLLKALDQRSRPSTSPCRTCYMLVHWDGHQFVHSDGQARRPYEPPIWLDPLDESKGQMLHWALPMGK